MGDFFSTLLRKRTLHPSRAERVVRATKPMYAGASTRRKPLEESLGIACTSCGKTFSRQTFRLDYYVKRVLSYEAIIQRLCYARVFRP
jgi:hypothetical protein